MRLAIVILLAAAAPARAELHFAPMTAASDDVCELLKADKHDRCRRFAHEGNATAYQSGTADLRRFVIAIARPGDDPLVSSSLDVHADGDAQLVATNASLRAIQLDGRPGVLLDVIAVHRVKPDAWQTESMVGCGQTAEGLWRCSALDVGRCEANIDGEGNVTACGRQQRLTLVR
jgi:hypothetical protein